MAVTTDIMLLLHRLRHQPRHGDVSAGHSHRQQLRCEADDWAENGRTVDVKRSGYPLMQMRVYTIVCVIYLTVQILPELNGIVMMA